MNPFRSLRDYEEAVYTVQQWCPAVVSSTLVMVRRGKGVAVLRGEVRLVHGRRLVLQERLDHHTGHVIIEAYGYELWRQDEKIAWYDSQPHPNDPALAGTFPHHKHVPPDPKRNRIPAPQLSFHQPNLPVLLQELQEVAERPAQTGQSRKPQPTP
ncbi:MAG: DUF6516 family protein [Thermodesulfobacteriota bacterium]